MAFACIVASLLVWGFRISNVIYRGILISTIWHLLQCCAVVLCVCVCVCFVLSSPQATNTTSQLLVDPSDAVLGWCPGNNITDPEKLLVYAYGIVFAENLKDIIKCMQMLHVYIYPCCLLINNLTQQCLARCVDISNGLFEETWRLVFVQTSVNSRHSFQGYAFRVHPYNQVSRGKYAHMYKV